MRDLGAEELKATENWLSVTENPVARNIRPKAMFDRVCIIIEVDEEDVNDVKFRYNVAEDFQSEDKTPRNDMEMCNYGYG